ncbi:MAG TPA: hypothetical protein VEP91_10990 [Solirubrobacterales bacterium]|nr:hypothetical protein [Solirubrobacterales bacterium]
MEAMAREVWTDERLDDLNHRVDEGFKEMRTEVRAFRAEMKSELQAVRTEIAAVNRNLMQLTWGLIGTMLVGFLGTFVALITQT